MTALLLASCALLSVLVPDPDLSAPYAGLPPCVPQAWTVTCAACSPPVVIVGRSSCVGQGDGSEEVLDLLPGKLDGWRSNNPEADLTVGEE